MFSNAYLNNTLSCVARYMLGLAGVPSVIQFFGFFGLPESPRWLMEKGRVDDARKALQQIRAVKGVDNELNEIQLAIDEQKKLSNCALPVSSFHNNL